MNSKLYGVSQSWTCIVKLQLQINGIHMTLTKCCAVVCACDTAVEAVSKPSCACCCCSGVNCAGVSFATSSSSGTSGAGWTDDSRSGVAANGLAKGRLLLVFEYRIARCSRCGYRTVQHSRCDSVLRTHPIRCRHEGGFGFGGLLGKTVEQSLG